MPFSSPDKELPPLPDHHDEGFNKLIEIVAILRSENGCPWDIKQTPASIKKYLIEECGELAEAIERGSPAQISEEMGDVLYIISMLIIMFEEQGSFSRNDVILQICEKMVRRHPHVFADSKLSSEHELREQWQRIKNLEKK